VYQVFGWTSFGAALFWEPGRPLTMEEFRMQRPKASEVLVKTKGPVSATPCLPN
jgi:Zn-dependent alcohol dehydrogenase